MPDLTVVDPPELLLPESVPVSPAGHVRRVDPETGRFLPGNRTGGRPLGSRSYEKVLSKASNSLAQAYVKHALKGNATILVDSRKVFLPDDPTAVPPSSLTIVVVDALRD